LQTLRAEGLTKTYKGRKVVDNVDITINDGEIVGLLGPNGAGKTTTFYMITGLARPEKGAVFLGETDITFLPLHRRARYGIGYLAQESSVFRKLTVIENVMAVLELTSLKRQEREEKARNLLEDFKILHLSDSKASALSGGERRRLEISRLLAVSPSFLLLDEPFAGIDPIAVLDIQGIITELKNKGIGVLITDHNVRETLQIVDRAYIINEGKIIESGAPEKIVSSEKARTFYLGKNFSMM
jgi:lipopolysaccharide export system ATP-binding protein